jgi:hypothetical protein
VLTHREDRTVPGHYGSPAGELAACIRAAGLAWRSDLVVGSAGPGGTSRPFPGGAEFDHDGWRCRLPQGATTLCVGRPSSRVFAPSEAPGLATGVPVQASQGLGVLNLLGPAARALLAAAGLPGLLGDTAELPPFSQVRLAGIPAQLLIQTFDNMLVLVHPDDAPATWRTLVRAGHAHGAATVGIEAVERYLLAERRRPGRSLAI